MTARCTGVRLLLSPTSRVPQPLPPEQRPSAIIGSEHTVAGTWLGEDIGRVLRVVAELVAEPLRTRPQTPTRPRTVRRPGPAIPLQAVVNREYLWVGELKPEFAHR